MNDLNFFSEKQRLLRQKQRQRGLLLLPILLSIVVVATLWGKNLAELHTLEEEIQADKTVLTQPENKKRLDQYHLLQQHTVRDQNLFTELTRLEAARGHHAACNTSIMRLLWKSLPAGASITELTADEAYFSLKGQIDSLATLAAYEKALVQSDLFQQVHIEKLQRSDRIYFEAILTAREWEVPEEGDRNEADQS